MLAKSIFLHSLIGLQIIINFCSCRQDKNCPDGSHQYIQLENNSNIASNFVDDDTQEDTLWTNNGQLPNTGWGLIMAHSSDKIGSGKYDCWENYYAHVDSKYYYVFNHDSVTSLGWAAISGTNRGLLKRVKVDLNYLNSNNFTISYP